MPNEKPLAWDKNLKRKEEKKQLTRKTKITKPQRTGKQRGGLQPKNKISKTMPQRGEEEKDSIITTLSYFSHHMTVWHFCQKKSSKT